MLSNRRKISSILLGWVYGACLSNGTELGLEYVLKPEEYVIGLGSLAEGVLEVASGALGGFLAAYSAQSIACGIAATGILAIFKILIVYLFMGDTSIADIMQVISPVTPILVVGIGVPAAFWGRKLHLTAQDIDNGELFGVSWKHWLWLWFPWQGMIASAVWVAYPASLMAGKQVIRTLIYEIIKAPLSVGLIGYATFKGLESIRADSPLTRLQAALRFIGWVFLFPILVNIWRLIF